MDRGAWQATVHRATDSQTWLSTAHSIPNLSLQFPVLTVPDLGENLKLGAVILKKEQIWLMGCHQNGSLF